MKGKVGNLAIIGWGIVIGFCVFWVIYGLDVLNVTNDTWIMQGYDEYDIIQHYAGWCAYRNSTWQFPLGLADEMAFGTYISYTDSIPLAAIFFKLLLQIVHYEGTFQYFGIYTLGCYTLQAISAGFLMRRKTKRMSCIVTIMILLCFSPILMERAFRHTALGSQWLILFALYYYLKCKDAGYDNYPVAFYVLSVLAITIHPYFIPCTMIFALVMVAEALIHKKRQVYFCLNFGLNLVVCAGVGVVIGVLGTGVETSRSGYGYYSMNLNALFNPSSCGGYTWSDFFKVQNQVLGNYDGFNYLGLGILFLIALVCYWVIADGGVWKQCLREHMVFLIAMLWMTLFAVSNVVTIGDKTFTITLPGKLVELCGIFRASSRMFYAVYYSMIIYSLGYLVSKTEGYVKIKSFVMVAGILVLQLTDLHSVIEEKHDAMEVKVNSESLLTDSYLAEKLKNYQEIISLETESGVAVCAAKNHLKVLYSVANSGTYEKATEYVNEKWQEMENGHIDKNLVYETVSVEQKDYILSLNPDAECYEAMWRYFIFP